jgi:hypothetical protein
MLKRSGPELNDFYAFYSIKACAYLGAKKQNRFDSNVEKDAVTRIIGDAWRSLSLSGKLLGLGAASKLSLFESWPMALPLFGMDANRKVLQANFRRGSRLKGDDRCCCGSGLTYMQCCGRTSSVSERFCE